MRGYLGRFLYRYAIFYTIVSIFGYVYYYSPVVRLQINPIFQFFIIPLSFIVFTLLFETRPKLIWLIVTGAIFFLMYRGLWISSTLTTLGGPPFIGDQLTVIP